MVATVAESVAILATAAAAQPSKSAEICASVAHWAMRSLILVDQHLFETGARSDD